MKRLLALISAAALLISLSVACAAETAPKNAKTDVSIFFQDPEIICECVCVYMGVEHLIGDGTFFLWTGEKEKIPSKIEGCFEFGPGEKMVVFSNGVPNLPNDLFKAWENGTDDVYIPDTVTEIDEDCFVEGSHITIHFTKNNATALAYAQKRGMAFEVMDGEGIPGDVNFDQETDMKDVLSLRKYIAHMPAAVEVFSLDINGDENTDMKDVLTLRKQIANAE